MTFAEIDWLSVALRFAVYVGTIAIAGSVLVRATLNFSVVDEILDKQIAIGALLLMISEPMRYVVFQLSIAQGDWSIAFDPAMRWMGAETPLGQAALIRLIGVIIVLCGLWWRPLALGGACLVVGSFLIEGHTVASDHRILLAGLLFIHFVIAHWWFAALVPLRGIAIEASNEAAAKETEKFGRNAMVAVALMVVVGVTLLGELVEWRLNTTSPYQQGFFLKLAGVVLILAIAGLNKLKWTTLLAQDPERARKGLRLSINIEILVAAAILFATAVATSFPPAGH